MWMVTARRLRARQGLPSIRIGEGDPRSVGLPYPGLGAWTPGMTPRLAPEGVGRMIPRGSDVVLQIHYHPTGKPERDQSSVGLFLAKKPVDQDDGGLLAMHGPDRHSRPARSVTRSSSARASKPTCTSTRPCPTPMISAASFAWPQHCRTVPSSRCCGSRTGTSTGRTSTTSSSRCGCPRDTVITLAAYFDNSAENPRNPHRPPGARALRGRDQGRDVCLPPRVLPDDPSGYAAYPAKSPFGL